MIVCQMGGFTGRVFGNRGVEKGDGYFTLPYFQGTCRNVAMHDLTMFLIFSFRRIFRPVD